ncbi:MAG: 2-oxo acid dehydrogenase subunit E2 [Streptosporangiaceae bacterium]|nr:2-oxo acid dehydrogenase subunit E2 [Streptosporangiaceae bacterium]
MNAVKEFRLPDVGEGLTEADIVAWHVKPGDTVKDGQVIVEIETAKAVVELPSPFSGTVASLLVDEGQTVDVGAPIITVDTSGSASPPPAQPTPAEPTAQPTAQPAAEAGEEPAAEATKGRQAVLVGYGVKQGATTRRTRKPPQNPPNHEMSDLSNGLTGAAGRPGGREAAGAAEETGRGAAAAAGTAEGTDRGAAEGAKAPGATDRGAATPGGPTASTGASHQITGGPAASEASFADHPAAEAFWASRPGDTATEASQAGGSGGLVSTPREITAKPPVRKMAKDLGISLAQLTGTGPAGSITREDVQRAAGETTARSSEAGLSRRDGKAADERIPVRGVQKHMAAAMVSSAFTAPHVTEFLTVDVTETMAAVRRVRELAEFEGVRVSPLLFVARALLTAVARHPMINSSWHADTQEILVKHQVNLGIAVAAERGLIVPNIKDAGALTLPALARALHELTETARAGKATPADLAGGSITITNVGVFGVDAGTPILTPGEAAILAFGQVKDTPWVVDGQLAVRKACTLSLSFDHRIIDGELGSAALRDVGSMLEDPVRMLAWS